MMMKIHNKINSKYITVLPRNCRRTRTVPYFDNIFETKYSNTIRQKFQVKKFSDRGKLTLSESYFIFILCL